MMYHKGKEIRDDAESVTEAFVCMVIVAVVARYIIGLFLYRGNYYLPFVNYELSKIQSWIILRSILFLKRILLNG